MVIASEAGHRSWRTWMFAIAGACAVVVATIGTIADRPPVDGLPVVVAGSVAILAQAAALRFRQANRTIYLGWGEAALIIVTFLLPPGWAPPVIGAGALAGQCLYRLRTGTPFAWRIVANAAHLTLAAAAGTVIAHLVAGGPIAAAGPQVLAGLVLGACAYSVVGVTFITLRFADTLPDFVHILRRTLVSKLPMVIGNVSIGIVFVLVFDADKRWLLIMPAVLILTYQTYVFRSRASDERRIWRDFADIARSLNQLDERGVAVAAVTGLQRLFVAAAVEVWVDRLGGVPRGYRGTPLHAGVEVVEISGQPVDHPVPPHATRALSIGGVQVGQVRVWMPSGSTLESRDHMALAAVGEAIAAALHDASAHRALRALAARSFHDANHDPLTGIPNRATLIRDGADAARALAPREGVAMLVLGLNRFKEVNDTLGHLAGDDLLRLTASRLAAFARPGDLVARLTGDEFAVLITELAQDDPEAGVRVRAEELAARLAVPAEVAGVTLAVEVSIGVAIGRAEGVDVPELLRRADIAMTRAKHGAGAVVVFGTADADRVPVNPDRLAVVHDLRAAMSHEDELVLAVQPALDLDTGTPVGVETFIRWHHPRRGLLGPGDFVDIVDGSDLVAPFTRYVLDHALAEAARWADGGLPLPVSVNLSPRSLTDAGLPTNAAALLERHRVAPGMLILEITESAVIDGQAVVTDVLTALRDLGVQLAVDDFGTGVSSLTFLTRVQVDEVKVDASFVGAMVDSPKAAAIVRTTLDLGRRLGVRVVAEGVETADQRRALRELGCVAAQGYHLVPPVDPDRAYRLLQELAATAAPDRQFPLTA